MDKYRAYVSRAGYKLASVADIFSLNFQDKIVLDVGSSTGGFTDFALQNGAKKVVAVEKGSKQLHESLRCNQKIELHENTDILDYVKGETFHKFHKFDSILIDVSFISLREILPSLTKLSSQKTQIVAMVKPQFESGDADKNKGIIKNEKIRRDILKNFEEWAKQKFVIEAKADSKIAGLKGNHERFYLLHIL